MSKNYFTDQLYEKINFTLNHLKQGEYVGCIFNNCDFSTTDLSNFKFESCTFTLCNLSMVKVQMTAFREVTFDTCKILGVSFEDCNDFGFSIHIKHSNLNHASFYKKKMKNTLFIQSQLHLVDFSACDLSSSVFEQCDLSGAIFEETNLENSDLRTAFNFSIDPELNRLKKATFSAQNISGLLDKYAIEIVE